MSGEREAPRRQMQPENARKREKAREGKPSQHEQQIQRRILRWLQDLAPSCLQFDLLSIPKVRRRCCRICFLSSPDKLPNIRQYVLVRVHEHAGLCACVCV
eukprot:6213418-Pleurochrysis_carterae.AAC.1